MGPAAGRECSIQDADLSGGLGTFTALRGYLPTYGGLHDVLLVQPWCRNAKQLCDFPPSRSWHFYYRAVCFRMLTEFHETSGRPGASSNSLIIDREDRERVLGGDDPFGIRQPHPSVMMRN